MFTVNYTTPAEEDLISILEYISNILKAPSAAENLLNEIEEQTKILEENPFIFPLAKDEYLNKQGIRHIAVKNYVLFYTIEEDKEIISVIRIMYARRDWINLLRED
jgi:addiction module RelE/StbE family toxin